MRKNHYVNAAVQNPQYFRRAVQRHGGFILYGLRVLSLLRSEHTTVPDDLGLIGSPASVLVSVAQ